MSEVKVGQTVSVHYIGTFDDGTEFDNSRERDVPLTFELGAGQMIPGFDSAINEMLVGETKTLRLDPKVAYGERQDTLVKPFPRNLFPPEFEFIVGKLVQGNASGQSFVAKIEAVNEDNVILDLNHPMAGKHLNFEVELLKAD